MLVDCGNIQVKVRLLERTEGENPFHSRLRRIRQT